MARTLVYRDVDASRLDRLRSALAAQGIALPGDAGEIRRDGADVAVSYDPQALTLTVEIKKAPWLMGTGRLAAKLDLEIRSAMEAV